MSDSRVYPVPEAFAAQANITAGQYTQMYQRSIDDPEGFWAEQASTYLSWSKPWEKVLEWSFEDDISIEWFIGGKLNVTLNCLDRHLEARGEQTAIIWEGDNPQEDQLDVIAANQEYSACDTLGFIGTEPDHNRGDLIR